MRAAQLKAHFATLRALAYPAYRRIWFGAFVSNVGTWVQTIAIGVYVTQTTGKAGWTGTIAALTYLPSVALGPIGGGLADRWDRRRLIAALSIVQALCAVGLAVVGLRGTMSLGAMASLVFVAGCANAVSAPAFNALLSEIVEPADLLSAVSLNSAQFNLARTLGPMLAAAILTLGGFGVAFVVNAAATVAVVVAVLSAPATQSRLARGGTLWSGIAEGFHVARSDPGIRLTLPLVLAVAVLVAPFIGLMPAYAINGFGRGAAGASMMATSQGIGALCAAFFANALATRWGVRKLLVRSLMLLAPIAAGYWLAPSYGLALALLAALGGVYLWTLSALSTTCMARVSREVQARINSLYGVTLSGGYSLGLIAQGWLTDHLGLRLVPAAAALLLLAIAVALRQRRAFEAIDAPCPYGGAVAAPAQPPINAALE